MKITKLLNVSRKKNPKITTLEDIRFHEELKKKRI